MERTEGRWGKTKIRREGKPHVFASSKFDNSDIICEPSYSSIPFWWISQEDYNSHEFFSGNYPSVLRFVSKTTNSFTSPTMKQVLCHSTHLVVIFQALSYLWLFENPRTATLQTSLPFTISPSLLKLMSIESVMPSNHLILFHPLLLLPSISPSIRVFSNELVLCIRWPKYWSFNFSISPSNEYSGWISFRIDWFALLATQGTLKSLLQHHSSKASILQCSAFFMVQLSHP